MATQITEFDLQFAQLAYELHYIQARQLNDALALHNRYRAAGGDVPSMARLMVGKEMLDHAVAEALLRHLFDDAPLPPPAEETLAAESQDESVLPEESQPIAHETVSAPAAQPTPVQAAAAEPPAAPDLPNDSAPATPPPDPAVPAKRDSRLRMIEGLGALVVSKDLLDMQNYKVLSVLGEGAMGTVYKARQLSMDRIVALKVLHAAKLGDPAFVAAFLAEARRAGRLNHPHLIRVYEVGKSGETFFYSMEFVDGCCLEEMMDEHDGGRLDPHLAVDIFSQAASALEYGLHAGLVHREIRPNAILLTSEGQVKLADLGLVKDEASRFLDGENAHYVAPEQVLDQPVDTRSDIYSLGCCLFHCLTGEAPFTGRTPRDVLVNRLQVPPPNPGHLNPDLPPELTAVILKMLARDPSMRYQTPVQVVTALRHATGGARASSKHAVHGTARR